MFFKTRVRWVKVFESQEAFESRVNNEQIINLKIDEEPFCIGNDNGKMKVFSELCPHQKAPLAGGACKNGEVICPWHKYAFCTETGRDLSTSGNALKVFPTELRSDGWYLGLERRVPFWMD